MNKKIIAQLLLVLVTLIWGATFIMVKEALNDAGPYAFAAMRFGIAGILALIISKNIIFNINRIEIIAGIICGTFLFSGYAFQNFGLIYTSASKSAFITSISVLIVPIILFLFKIQNINNKIWIAVCIATLGLYILINPNVEKVSIGDILTLGCALFFAIHIIFQDKYLKKNIRIIPFFLIQTWFVCILSLINSFIFETNFAILSNRLLIALFITGIGGTFIAFLVMIWAQKILDPNQTAIIFSLEPVFAAIFSILLAGEYLSILGWCGGVLIVFAVAWGGSD